MDGLSARDTVWALAKVTFPKGALAADDPLTGALTTPLADDTGTSCNGFSGAATTDAADDAVDAGWARAVT